MPVKMGRLRHTRSPKHKHTKRYLQTYWPYLPMLLIVLIGLILGGARPSHRFNRGVLGYATDVKVSGLLQATNDQRSAQAVAKLKLNDQLDSAAQAKANDMVTRNYWSHTTPDGQQPWIFIQQAGYTYIKAGENLAYGFANSIDVVSGWTNSPTHRANLLDSAFSEVGFGIANSSNFNQSGPETVVVAMYG
ncbi:CAP domain-containing protein, partial [Candidatus Saccharibacteria bacterium]|nr:CAP domain-containing protein [Candidatus Saccharibacteria bacterium]